LNKSKEIEKIACKESPEKEDILFLLNLEEENELNSLFSIACEIKDEHFAAEIPVFGTFEFSNYCEENCLYCKLREENFSIERYRLSADTIIDTLKKVSNLGLNDIILESGQDSTYDTDMISYMIFSLKQYSQDIKIYLSIGERGFDEYKTWRYSGIEGYILSHNTSNKQLFDQTHQRRNLDQRIRHLQYLKRSGLQTGTGIIVGLPGQTSEDIAGDILLSKELDSDFLLVQPFIPYPFTPYQHKDPPPINTILKSMAVARIVLKDVSLPFKLGDIRSNLEFDKIKNTGINVLLAQIVLVKGSSKIYNEHKSVRKKISGQQRFTQSYSPIKIFEESVSNSRLS
jgi:biotin synthase